MSIMDKIKASKNINLEDINISHKIKNVYINRNENK